MTVQFLQLSSCFTEKGCFELIEKGPSADWPFAINSRHVFVQWQVMYNLVIIRRVYQKYAYFKVASTHMKSDTTYVYCASFSP